jgi:FAD/FMN-containing dehydrogenase
MESNWPFDQEPILPSSKVPELVPYRGDRRAVDLRSQSDAIARARECVSETFQLSVELGGTISGEHGIGYVKSQYMHYAIDRPTLEIMKGIKHVFDPNGILNPGKMFV